MKIVKPAKLLDFGWSFPTNIITANSEKLPDTYLDECVDEAQRRNVLVYLVDFSCHKTLPDVFVTEQVSLLNKVRNWVNLINVWSWRNLKRLILGKCSILKLGLNGRHC
jgi:hypothetical protein